MSESKFKPTCNKCEFYVGIVSKGTCNFSPPKADNHRQGIFPVVYGQISWCGKFLDKSLALAERSKVAAKKRAGKSTAKTPKAKVSAKTPKAKVPAPPAPPK